VFSVHLIMLLTGSAVLLMRGVSASILWAYWPPFKTALVFLYALIALTLWWAPIYGWLLLVSAWTKRMTFLWAVLPPLGLLIVEKIGLDTSFFAGIISDRLTGFLEKAFIIDGAAKNAARGILTDQFSVLTPIRFLETPGLWLGLVATAVFLAGAVWLRRNREPI
jgi:ABC-2 type transport system permease protein